MVSTEGGVEIEKVAAETPEKIIKDLIEPGLGLQPYQARKFAFALGFNGERHKILKAEIGSGTGKVGEIISDRLEVACGNNQSIKIIEIQRQGKNPQKIGEFILGSKIRKGSIISYV